MPKALFIFLLAAACGFCLAPAAQADPAEYAGSSADGSKVFFTTTAKLVPGDTDNGFTDVYERFYDSAVGVETYVTREISTGPTGGSDAYNVTFDGVSGDGTKVFFSTDESLVAEDKDHSTDVYMRNTSTGATILVSQGASSCAPGCGNGADPATYVGSTPDGSKAFFTTNESLAEGDSGETRDVYVRDMSATPAPATTTLVSRPDSTCSGCGSEAPVTFQGASVDGAKIVFETSDKLAEGDGDGGESDIYERDLTAGRTALVSATGTCPAPLTASQCGPLYRGLSSDGTRVFFQTRAQLVAADEDKVQDVYEWSSSTGNPTLLSTSGEAEEGKGAFDAVFVGASPGGSEVFFETQEKLVGADGDGEFDLYERAGSGTILVSAGTAKPVVFNDVSANGSTVLFSTTEALGGGDSGGKLDVYSWSGGTPSLVSAGTATYDSNFAGASSDATKVFYTTNAQLSAADKDEKPDIYEGPGAPTLISTGPVGGNGAYTPHLTAVSEGGEHAFFTTEERLTVDDNFAAEQDVYDHSAGGTLLVSVANSGELSLGPPAPGLTGTNPASPGTSTEPAILGEAEPGAGIKVYATPDCSGAPVGIGTAAEIGGAFSVPVAVEPGSITAFHATASNGSGDTSGCSTTSVTYRQESAPPPPSEEGSGGGTGEGGGSGGTGGAGGSTDGFPSSTGSSGSGSTGSSGGIKIGGVVYVAPITRITFGPASKTRVRRPVFRFLDAAEQPGTSFVCKVDRHAWKGCNSPYKLPKLNPGRHVFSVKGKSAAGQWEQQPVSRKFKVVS